MVVYLFLEWGDFGNSLQAVTRFVVSCRKRTELAPTACGRKKQKIVSLTFEPIVIGPISLSLICDLSWRLLQRSIFPFFVLCSIIDRFFLKIFINLSCSCLSTLIQALTDYLVQSNTIIEAVSIQLVFVCL